MKIIRIFISSVQKEFSTERMVLRDYLRGDALMRRFFEAFLFEDVPAADRSADDLYLAEVEHCDIYLGLFGNEYGYEDDDGLSPTEREFNASLVHRKPRLIFVKGGEKELRHPKMQKLIQNAGNELIRRRFMTSDELRVGVYASLVQILEDWQLLRTGPFDAAVCPDASLTDLDEEAKVRFIRTARELRGFPLRPDVSFIELLTHLNLLNKGRLTHAAVLLFGKSPQRFLISSEVKCLHFHGTEKAKPIPSYQVYKGRALELVDQAFDFVLSKINLAVSARDERVQADATYEIPPKVVREAIVNAIAHRDYTSNGSVQVMLFADRLEVWNPGTLPPSLTLEKLRKPHGSFSANPLLAESLYLAGVIERIGTGTGDMITLCRDSGLREPDFSLGDGFVVCIWRPKIVRAVVPTDEVMRRYQAALKEELGYIRMLGMPGVDSVKVNLNDDTFVPLRLSDRQENGSLAPENSDRKGGEHILYPDEIMKQAFHDRRGRRMLLVIGDPGAGKTTLIKYYALCVLEDHFKRLGFAAPVPVFYLPLRDLARDKEGGYDTLPANLARWSKKHHQTLDVPFFEEALHRGISLVLLDGLDEISNTEERIKVCKWIDAAWSGFSKALFVVTSRATGYRKDEGIELEADYERADVQDFTVEQQERFLKNWFTGAFLQELCPKEVDEKEWARLKRTEALERTEKMVAHLKEEKNKGLRQLAAIPMILQIMAILWKDRDYMPESRVKLYEASLDYLLEFRDKRRGIVPLLSAVRARQVLAPVSLWMQEKLKKDEAGRADMQRKMGEELDKQDKPPAVEDFCDYLVKRAGLLVETAAHDYLFRHKSFREYLAGVELVKRVLRSSSYLDTLISGFGDDWWDEPIRFFIAQVDAELFDLFMEKLFDSPVSDELTQKQQLLLQTIIEEAPLKKVDALCKKLLDPATTVRRQRVILDCLKAINKPGALDALLQFSAKMLVKNDDVASRADEVIIALGGKALDRASEKSVSGKRWTFRNPNEQNAEYILIPGGIYIYSVTKREESVNDLYVAKYPVTNKLYRSFITLLREKGTPVFRAELEMIAQSNAWGEGFDSYLKDAQNDLASLFQSKYDEDRKLGGDEQPVVGVTWYAAKAYCLWLSLLEGETGCYRLPNEVEWEWVAGGKRGTIEQKVRKYPWPDEMGSPTAILANYHSNVGHTTPVGSYPEGSTPEGLYNMGGNVWEWMENYYVEGEFTYSLRGGSWFDDSGNLRCSARNGGLPVLKNYSNGFRVVRSSHSF